MPEVTRVNIQSDEGLRRERKLSRQDGRERGSDGSRPTWKDIVALKGLNQASTLLGILNQLRQHGLSPVVHRPKERKVAAVAVYQHVNFDFMGLDAFGREAGEHGVGGGAVGDETDSLSVELVGPQIVEAVGINESGIFRECRDKIHDGACFINAHYSPAWVEQELVGHVPKGGLQGERVYIGCYSEADEKAAVGFQCLAGYLQLGRNAAAQRRHERNTVVVLVKQMSTRGANSKLKWRRVGAHRRSQQRKVKGSARGNHT